MSILAKLRPQRSWLQLRLRTMLLLVLVANVPLGIYAHLLRKVQLRRELFSELDTAGAFADYEGCVRQSGKQSPPPAPGPAWLRARLGDDDIFRPISSVGVKVPNSLDDRLLARLTCTCNLVRLEICASQVTDAGLRQIARFPRLTHLDCTCCLITDQSLPVIAQRRALTWLGLNCTKVTDAGLVHLIQLPALETLDLSGAQVTDEGLKSVGQLTSLKNLDLFSTNITGRGLAHLAALRNLETLSLTRLPLDGDGSLEPLAKLTALKDLNLRDCKLSSRVVAPLSRLSELTTLQLSDNELDDDSLRPLGQCKKLVSLALNNTRVTGSGLRHLHSLQSLQSITLFHCPVDPKYIVELQAALPACDVVFSPRVSDN